jgi:hypothetical protein
MSQPTDNRRPKRLPNAQAFALNKKGKATEIFLRPEGIRRVEVDKYGKKWVFIGMLPNGRYLCRPLRD